tara:strand:+ start:289 stop:726 length:438 start_codon:yes stop_codon:yes gene_type:complete
MPAIVTIWAARSNDALLVLINLGIKRDNIPAKTLPNRGENIAIKYMAISTQPLIILISSTAIDPRFLKYTTNIAKPIAASPAATVRINKAKTCPTRSPKYDEKATKLIFTDNRMSSIDIRIIITFFLFKKIPKTPKVRIIEDRIK